MKYAKGAMKVTKTLLKRDLEKLSVLDIAATSGVSGYFLKKRHKKRKRGGDLNVKKKRRT